MCIYPIILVVFALLMIVFTVTSRAQKQTKIALIILALLSFVAAFFLPFLIHIYIFPQERMEQEALGFVHEAISGLRAGKVPPLSANINESDANKIRSLVNHLPDGDYKVELFGEPTAPYHSFRVRFSKDNCFECMVEPYDADRVEFELFIRTEWKLYLFERADCNRSPKEEQWGQQPFQIK